MVKYLKTDSGYFYEISDSGKKLRISKEDYELNKKTKKNTKNTKITKNTKNTKMRGGAAAAPGGGGGAAAGAVVPIPIIPPAVGAIDPDGNDINPMHFPLIRTLINPLRNIICNIYELIRNNAYNQGRIPPRPRLTCDSDPLVGFENSIKYYNILNGLYTSLVNYISNPNPILLKQTYINEITCFLESIYKEGLLNEASAPAMTAAVPAQQQQQRPAIYAQFNRVHDFIINQEPGSLMYYLRDNVNAPVVLPAAPAP
jgi:hypothetical protein